jgi:hypothetical protein
MDNQALKEIQVDTYVVGNGELNDIGVRNNGHHLFGMKGAETIDGLHHAHLRLTQRLTIREAGTAGVELHAWPEFMLVELLQFRTLPLTVVNFPNLINEAWYQATGLRNGCCGLNAAL